MINKRQFDRIKFNCKVKFQVDNSLYDCQLLDISLRGALITDYPDNKLKINTLCKLTLTLDQSSNKQIIMEGKISHENNNRIGISCQYIDVDSISHLRKLIELNKVAQTFNKVKSAYNNVQIRYTV